MFVGNMSYHLDVLNRTSKQPNNAKSTSPEGKKHLSSDRQLSGYIEQDITLMVGISSNSKHLAQKPLQCRTDR